jgi:apolipoprotein N-acyltransferase
LRRGFLLAYFCGMLWWAGNCYWVRYTMLRYGDMPTLGPTLLLVAGSLALGLYFALFGLGVALVRRSTGSIRLALASAPVLWAAMELAASRISSTPWDQLGYSQVDNALVNQLAPWTGIFGISFVLVGVNALLAGGLLLDCCAQISFPQNLFPKNLLNDRRLWGLAGVVLLVGGMAGLLVSPPRPEATATAVLVQPNLDVARDRQWTEPEWNRHIGEFLKLAGEQCKIYIAGIPQTGAPKGEIVCPPYRVHPDLVVWPESPAPFFEGDLGFQDALIGIAHQTHAPLIVGSEGADYSAGTSGWRVYNSALIMGADARRVGRYDKIHLVPLGEYIPLQNLLFFAHKLAGRAPSITRGTERKVFRLNGRRYGVFICYEAVFADEVREFVKSGAEVLVNISDDGWYGDTSAPWQHLNITRMRAIENRRWLLRDTNDGITAVIDPYGRVRQSIPRHAVDALPAGYGFRDDVTFYTAHGDVFGWACVLISFGLAGWMTRKMLRLHKI